MSSRQLEEFIADIASSGDFSKAFKKRGRSCSDSGSSRVAELRNSPKSTFFCIPADVGAVAGEDGGAPLQPPLAHLEEPVDLHQRHDAAHCEKEEGGEVDAVINLGKIWNSLLRRRTAWKWGSGG